MTVQEHRNQNILHSILLLTGMVMLLAGLGHLLAGSTGAIMALGFSILGIVINPGLSPHLLLRMYRAQPLDESSAPDLNNALQVLAQRANLPYTPALFYIPSDMINAFAVGSHRHAAIALTQALLERMPAREIIGVLAHEISHVKNHDTWVMGVADLFSRLTASLSLFGQILVFINLPLLIFTEYSINWYAILLLILAPNLSALLQLALSRTREYNADLGAVELTGDPAGLAQALVRLEQTTGRYMEQLFRPGSRLPSPSILRTHPPTEERVRRLMELAEARQTGRSAVLDSAAMAPPVWSTQMPAYRRPRRHISGLWY